MKLFPILIAVSLLFLGTISTQTGYSQIDPLIYCLEECENYEKTRSFVLYSAWTIISIGLGIFGFKLIKSKNFKKSKKIISYSLTVMGSILAGFSVAILINIVYPPWSL